MGVTVSNIITDSFMWFISEKTILKLANLSIWDNNGSGKKKTNFSINVIFPNV